MRLYVFDFMRDGKESLHAYWAESASKAREMFYFEVSPRNGDSWTLMLVTQTVTKSSVHFS